MKKAQQEHRDLRDKLPQEVADMMKCAMDVQNLVDSPQGQAYRKCAEDALEAMRQWAIKNNIAALPEDAFQLPKDAPIWEFQLSLFQAGWVLANLRTGLPYSERRSIDADWT